MKTENNDTKKIFAKQGTCSRTFCYLVNRGFGCNTADEECAADPLAGGIMLRGHQCGMLWGSTLAAGAESFRRYGNSGRAVAAAVTAAKGLAESYSKRAKSVNCRDVCGHDFTKRLELFAFMAKFMLHINRHCFDLAEEWAPEAMRAASEGLAGGIDDVPGGAVSCASEVARKMGADDRETIVVAGLAGGMGLGGHGCGALGAAIWMKSLEWCRKNPGKTAYKNPAAADTLKAFLGATGNELLCRKIAGLSFTTMRDHTEYIKSGGCDKLIDLLARS